MEVRRYMTFANVMSLLAVFMVLGGGAFAASELAKIKKNSVGTKQLKDDAVNSKKVKPNSLKGSDIKESTLGQVPSAAGADQLDGLDANGIVRATTATDVNPIVFNEEAAFTDLVGRQVTAPGPGILVVEGQVNVNRLTGDPDPAEMRLRGAVDGAAATTETNVLATQDGTIDHTGTVSGAVAVSAGSHAVSLQGLEVGGQAFITDRSVTTTFVPFGDAGQAGVIDLAGAEDANR